MIPVDEGGLLAALHIGRREGDGGGERRQEKGKREWRGRREHRAEGRERTNL
jgi:hypothetical protein